METPSENTGLSRRAVIGGLGVGLGAVGAGLLATGSAGAASVPAGQRSSALASVFPQVTTPTAVNPALRYNVHCGYDFLPIDSDQTWTTNGGSFRFTAAGSGFAGVLAHLPTGSVIKELELYGTRAAAGVVRLDLWNVNQTSGAITNAASSVVPAAAGDFTVTLPTDVTQDTTIKSRPFVFIDAAAAPTTFLRGLRVGYVSPTGFIALPTAINPRVLDTRAGGTKLQPNEERTITLPVPGGVAVVLTLTATRTVGGGFISVFQAGIPWPGNSSINFVDPDQSIANTVISAVSADSKIVIRGGQSATDVIIDVAGWIA